MALSVQQLVPKIFLATCAGAAAYLLAGWLVFERLLGRFTKARTIQLDGFYKSPEEASLALLAASCAAYALLLAILMSEGYADVHSVRDGASLGATVGVLVAIMADTYWYATTNFYSSALPVLADVGAAGLTVGIMGGVIGGVLGRCQEHATSGGGYSEL
jgi:hypothetical protein